MSNMGIILILEQGREEIIISSSDVYELLLGKGARVLDLMKTPSGHLALKVDECGAAAEYKRSMSFCLTANPHWEDAPLLVKEAAGAEPAAGQAALCNAGTPALSDAHTYMVSQDAKGLSPHRPTRTSPCETCRRRSIRPSTTRAISRCCPTRRQGHLRKGMMPLR
eukprot:5283956-Pyramimonas_sp.AAC.1